MADLWHSRARRAVGARLRDGIRTNGDGRPHYIVCGQDPLAYRLVTELLDEAARVTVIVPSTNRSDGPDIRTLRGIRIIRSDRLDEDTFRAAGLSSARGLALMHQNDVGNLHAALCAQEVAPGIRVVIRMFNTGLGRNVKRLFSNCEVLSDATMAAPAFVAAALGEIAPTYFHYFGRTLFVARRDDVDEQNVVCGLADTSDPGHPKLLPGDQGTADLVLAEATGQPAGTDLAARRIVAARRKRRRRRPLTVPLRALRFFVTRKIGLATLAVLAVMAVFGTLLAHAAGVNPWQALYLTLIMSLSGADPDTHQSGQLQLLQVGLIFAGMALIPLLTASVVDGMVKARFALHTGRLRVLRNDHIVVVGLGNVGTRVIRQLTQLGVEVVAIDKDTEARGAAMARRLGVPFVVGDASEEETLRLASVEAAQALVVVSTDDVSNLQAALHAKIAKPDLRVVLRLFDGDLADRLQRAFDIGVSHSVSYLAAHEFAAKLVDREVIATIPIERRVLLVTQVTVADTSPLVGQPISAVNQPHKARVIAVTPADQPHPRWSLNERDLIAPGDRLTVVARKSGLGWLLKEAAAPVAPDIPTQLVRTRAGKPAKTDELAKTGELARIGEPERTGEPARADEPTGTADLPGERTTERDSRPAAPSADA